MTQRSALMARRPLAAALFVALIAPGMAFAQTAKEKALEARVAELERRYAAGDDIGDGHIKIEVAEAIDALIAPMRERRAAWDDRDDDLIDILREGSRRANAVAEETLAMAKEAAGLGFWKRSLSLD